MARPITELRKQDVRDTLLDAGVRTLLASGYARTSVDDIVREAGVPKGSFYYYFDSKEVLAACAVERYAQLDANARDELEKGTGTALERLYEYFENYVVGYQAQDYRGGCLLGNLGLEMADLDGPVRATVQAQLDAWTRSIARVLTEAAASGALSARANPAALAAFLVNAWEGALLRMRIDKSATPLREFMAVSFDELLKP